MSERDADGDVVIEGSLARLSLRDAAESAAVVVTDEGEHHRVVGDLGELRVGTPVRLVARRCGPDDGAARRIVELRLSTPETPAAIERFLASGFFPGVSRALARRLVAHFGAETLRVIETSPARLLDVDGIGRARASRLAGVWAEHRHLQDVATMLRGHGVSTAFASRMARHGGDVMWLPTPPAVIEAMLDLARVTADDHVIDLGAGDGAMVLAAARRGARAHGVESNPELVAAARRRADEVGLADLASFSDGDLFAADLAPATVITMFLLPGVNLALRPRLLALRPGTRVVSNTWGMGDWAPDATATVDDESLAWRTALLWIVPGPDP